jgi:ketosteroid isomerase-like protein
MLLKVAAVIVLNVAAIRTAAGTERSVTGADGVRPLHPAVERSLQASSDVARELTRFEHQLGATWKKGDCDAWGAMVAPDWSVIHMTGEVITRAQALEMCRTPAVSIETFDIDDIVVRQFGDTAVVTGRTRIVTGGAAPVTVSLRFTDVILRRAGRWQVVASHATRLGS